MLKYFVFNNKVKITFFLFFIALCFLIFFPSFYNAVSRARISTIKSNFFSIEEKLFLPVINTIYNYGDNPNWHFIYKELTKFYKKNEKLNLYTERYKNSRFTNESDKINETMIPINIYNKLEMKELYFGCIVYDLKYIGKENGLNNYMYTFYYVDRNGEFLRDEYNRVILYKSEGTEIK